MEFWCEQQCKMERKRGKEEEEWKIKESVWMVGGDCCSLWG